MIETRRTENRYVTSDLKKMLNMYLAKRVLKTWTENFVDADTGEVVSIERNEVLFERGTLVDRDVLSQIQFFMSAGDITSVEVSNQKRLAFENENKALYPYLAQAQISDKKYKFLLYATGLENVITILKDYIELNYQSGFTITMAKEFDSCIILTDNLRERKVDGVSEAYLKNEISTKEYMEAMDSEDNEDEGSKQNEKKFYQIETKVLYGDEDELTQVFVVQTFNVDRAMMLITHFLKKKEEEYERKSEEKGNDYKKRNIQTSIESAKPIPIGCFIPKEFSMVYL